MSEFITLHWAHNTGTSFRIMQNKIIAWWDAPEHKTYILHAGEPEAWKVTETAEEIDAMMAGPTTNDTSAELAKYRAIREQASEFIEMLDDSENTGVFPDVNAAVAMVRALAEITP